MCDVFQGNPGETVLLCNGVMDYSGFVVGLDFVLTSMHSIDSFMTRITLD